MSLNTAPGLELTALEDRAVPAMFGTPWLQGESLTVGFAQEGTSIDGQSSSLSAHMSSTYGSGWQEKVLSGFQSWAVHANVNFGLVSDDGAAFGSEAAPQGVAGRADVRLGAAALSQNEMAISTPMDVYADRSGDVIFNTQYAFSDGGTGDTIDLFTAALHEAGHVLGLGNSEDSNSVMYTRYEDNPRAIGSMDVSAVQELYGPRQPDAQDAVQGNGSRSTASALGYATSANPTHAAGDLQTVADVDWYKVSLPSGQNALYVSLRTSGISLLTAELGIYDGAGNRLTGVTRTDPLDGDIQLTATGLSGDADYFLKVESGRGDAFGVGSYRLAAGPAAAAAVADPAGTGDGNESGGGNNSMSAATALANSAAALKSWEYVEHASLTGGDHDWYRVQAPAGADDTMVVGGWSKTAGMTPLVRVFGANGASLPFETLTDGDGASVVQVKNVTAGATYYVKVSKASGPAGAYVMGVDFRAGAVGKEQFAVGTLGVGDAKDTQYLYNHRSQVVRFELYNQSTGSAAPTVTLTIKDTDGNVVLSLSDGNAGGPAVGQLLLRHGVYVMEFTTDSTLQQTRYALLGQLRSDPIGPVGTDPSDDPTVPPPPPPPPGEDPPPMQVSQSSSDDPTDDVIDWFTPPTAITRNWAA